MRPGAERRGEQGATLVMVLVILAVFGLVLMAVASFGATEIRAGVAYRTQRQRAVAAEGAVNGAINYLRGDAERGRQGLSCPDFNFPFEKGTARVACEALDGSGEEGFEEPDPRAIAGYALVTTSGLSGYPAVTIDKRLYSGIDLSGNTVTKLGGPVASNSTVKMSGGAHAGLTTDYALVATGACSGNIVANPKRCNLGLPIPEPGGGATTDPAPGTLWASSLQQRPAAGSMTCNTATGVATMTPGAYTAPPDPVARGCGVLWMMPGDYYLDFLTTTMWSVDYTLVGGTPSGWDPHLAGQAPPPYDPAGQTGGACDPAEPGVQIVFGGDSILKVTGKADLQICGPPASPSELPIVIYGRKSATPPVPRSATFRPAAVAAPATLAPLAAIDYDQADPATFGAFTVGSNTSSTVILSGYGLSGVPPGSVLTKASVRVSHGETTSDGGALSRATLTMTAGGQTLCSGTLALHAGVASDALPCAIPAALAPWAAPTDAVATLTFGTKNSQSATVTLDGVELDLEWTEPGMRPQRMGLPFLQMEAKGGNKSLFFVRGTVYAPRGSVDLDFKNNNGTAFTGGSIIHSLRGVNVPPWQTWLPFATPMPGVSPIIYSDRRVRLTATVDGRTQVRAVVVFEDDKGRTPGQKVDVESWLAES